MAYYWVDTWTFKKIQKNQKNNGVTRGMLLSWHVYILKKIKKIQQKI